MSPEAVTTRSIVISERVSVPVLSEQITEAEPSVSTDDSFLTIALRLAMRCTPIASTTDRIAGSPSGTAATASDTPSSSTVINRRRSRIVGDEQDRADDDDGDHDHGDAEHAPDAADSFCSGVGSSTVRLEQRGDRAHLGAPCRSR